MNRKYKIAGHCFEISGEQLCEAVSLIEGFKPFEVRAEEPVFFMHEGKKEEIPLITKEQYTFDYEDVRGTFGRTSEGFCLQLKPTMEDAFYLWCKEGEPIIYLQGNWSMRLYRFALWVGYGLMTLGCDTLAIHSSCIVYQGKAVLFLGESGTGKSSLINELGLDVVLKTNEISKALNRGKHTTRHTELLRVGTGWLADTPGFGNLAFIDMKEIDIAHSMIEMFELSSMCKYSGCLHEKEPKCIVKEKVQNKEILESRYNNYLLFLEEVRKQRKW